MFSNWMSLKEFAQIHDAVQNKSCAATNNVKGDELEIYV
jgi:hypothetical protein